MQTYVLLALIFSLFFQSLGDGLNYKGNSYHKGIYSTYGLQK